MFFDDRASVRIISVMEMSWSATDTYVKGRDVAALSIRLRGNSCITENRVSERLTDGDVLYMPKGADYRLVTGEERILVVHFDADCGLSPHMSVFHPSEGTELRSLFSRLREVWMRREMGYTALALSVLYRIFYELARLRTHGTADASQIASSVAYLHSHYTDASLTVAALARRAYMSDTYFRRIFRRLYGKNPHDYITDLRMEHAKALLRENRSVKGASLSSGFSDAKHFSTLFRKRMGKTPSEYRNG